MDRLRSDGMPFDRRGGRAPARRAELDCHSRDNERDGRLEADRRWLGRTVGR